MLNAMHADEPWNAAPGNAAPGANEGVAIEDVAVESQEWERTLSLCMHLCMLSGVVGVPIVPTLVLWLLKRDQSAFADDHGREALNFQISLTIYAIGAFLVGLVTCGVGYFIVYPALLILALVGLIQGISAAHKGRFYRYPACLRFVK